MSSCALPRRWQLRGLVEQSHFRCIATRVCFWAMGGTDSLFLGEILHSLHRCCKSQILHWSSEKDPWSPLASKTSPETNRDGKQPILQSSQNYLPAKLSNQGATYTSAILEILGKKSLWNRLPWREIQQLCLTFNKSHDHRCSQNHQPFC